MNSVAKGLPSVKTVNKPVKAIKDWVAINEFVAVGKYPELPCPYCASGSVSIDETSLSIRPLPEAYKQRASRHYVDPERLKQDRLRKSTEIVSEAANAHPAFGLLVGFCAVASELSTDEMDVKQCLAFLQCSHCKGSVSATGLIKSYSSVKQDKAPTPIEVKFEHFAPIIPMMRVADNVPLGIQAELYDSFKHYHFDPCSAASKLRRAIEQFCKDMGAEGGNLHHQISSLRKTHPEEAEYLEALKLIGNEGTHSDGVEELDLLQAYHIFQYVLELYDRRARYQATLADYKELKNKFTKEK